MTGAARAGVLAALAACAAGGCGKRGDPLPPLRPAPAVIADLSARRLGDRIELSFTIPAKNADNTTPPAVEREEVYALVADAAKPPTLAALQQSKNLREKIEVRPPADDTSTPPADAPKDTRPAAGDAAAYRSTISKDSGLATSTDTQSLYYVVIGVAGNRRTPSPIVAVPLAAAPAPPLEPKVTYDEKTLTVTWQPGASGQEFRVYEVDGAGTPKSSKPLTTAPLKTAEFASTVEFGKERCFAVHAVRISGPTAVESEPARVCKTPVDTFPPPVPVLHAPVPSDGAVSLIWDAVTAGDLAGYFVLRGEGADDKLQPLMTAPILATTYRDETTRAGIRYVYAIQAADKAGNRSAESNRVIAIGR